MNKMQAAICLLSVTIIWASELIVLYSIPESVEPIATTCMTKTIGALLLFICFSRRILAEIREYKLELINKCCIVAVINCAYNTMMIVGIRGFDTVTGNFLHTFTAVSMPVLFLEWEEKSARRCG